MKCLKSASRLLNKVYVEGGGLDPSKVVLWVSVSQRAAELPAGKVGGLEKNFATRPTLHLKIKKLSTNSPRDFNSVLDTMNHY